MATATGRARCITCGKEKATSKCEGCLQDFCFNHLTEHRQQLSKQLDEIEVNRDQFRQTLIQQTIESRKQPLIEQIDQWELNAIQKIQQTAEELRQSVLKYTTENIHQIEDRLSKLTRQLQQSRREDDITEIDLQKWREEIIQLTEQFTKLSEMKIQENSNSFIASIHVDFIGECVKTYLNYRNSEILFLI
jgi:hypothetical protein